MSINITTRDRVVAILNKHGPQTKAQILERLGDEFGKMVTPRHLQRLIHALIETGHVKVITPKSTRNGGDHRFKNVYSLVHLPGELDGDITGPADRLEAYKAYTEEGLLQNWIPWLKENGYTVQKQPVPNMEWEAVNRIQSKDYSGDVLKVGAISDTHLGSVYQQLQHLETMYDLFEQEGVTEVLHAGDLMDGGNIFKGQEFELFVNGPQQQIEYSAKYYPKRKGITTHAIAGNHDDGWKGLDANKYLATLRPDINYLGIWLRPINISGVNFQLHHGARGPGAVLSKRTQDAIDEWVNEDNPADVFIQGHYHKTHGMEEHRGVWGMMPGCFQATTPYIRRLAGHAHIGGNILTIRLGKDGKILSKGKEWFPFKAIEDPSVRRF